MLTQQPPTTNMRTGLPVMPAAYPLHMRLNAQASMHTLVTTYHASSSSSSNAMREGSHLGHLLLAVLSADGATNLDALHGVQLLQAVCKIAAMHAEGQQVQLHQHQIAACVCHNSRWSLGKIQRRTHVEALAKLLLSNLVALAAHGVE